jgi:hypothetical protein
MERVYHDNRDYWQFVRGRRVFVPESWVQAELYAGTVYIVHVAY